LIPYIKRKLNAITKKINTSAKIIIAFNIVDFIIISLICILFYLTISLDSKRVIFIPKGSTQSVISYLNKEKYGLNIVDYYIINLIGYPQSGWIDLKAKTMSKYDFIYKVCTSKAALRDITLVPGETYYYFLQDISKKLKIDFESLLTIYYTKRYKLDGNIVPQTYSLPIGMKADELISYLFSYSENEYKKYSKKIFGTYEKENWYKYITIASIIQKESANNIEMSIVSSVIYNRLSKNMKLQMDGTLNYGEFSHTTVTSKMIKEDSSTYNTYKNNGIPQNPVCAVSFNAIKSAIFPKKTNYLYFVKAPNKNEHIFSTSLKKHNKHVKKYKKSIKKKKKSTPKKLHIETITPKDSQKKSLKELWKNVNTGR
jgi:UPF0755 protein